MSDENPWGKKPNKQNDIDDFIDKNVKKFFGSFKQKGESGKGGDSSDGAPPTPGKLNLLIIGLLIFLGYVTYQSVYQIQPGELGVVLRFGQHDRTTSPGLNYAIPFAERVFKVDVETVRNINFGFRGQENFSRSQNVATNSRVSNNQSLIVTGDRNVINLNWVVQYRISDPVAYLFNIRNGEALVKDFSEFVIRRLVGNRDFDYVLDRREELAFDTKKEMQDLLTKFKTGIELVTVQLLDVTPPEPVRPSFNEVNEADQDKTRLVNEAQKKLNEEIPKARGEAEQLIRNAEGYAVQRVNEAKGDVSRFKSIYEEYRQFKDVTKTRMYLETMKKTIPTLEQVIIVDKDNNLLPLLNLNQQK